jgi:pimeloyl-ACP methyl ester carboxylesterase
MSASTLGRLAAATLGLALAGCSAGLAASSAPTVAPSPTAEAYVADIDVGGRTLHIVCVGPTDTGRPTVIFENGLGGDRRGWAEELVGLKATERACSYDRAGIEESERATGPRTTQDQVDDLHALLSGAGIAPPFILVGHSIAGWNLLVYTEDYPDEVAGIVLVDVRPAAMSRRLLLEMPPETPDESDVLHQSRVEFTTMDIDPSMNPEGLLLRESADQALAAPGFGSRPTAILWTADWSELWKGMDADLAARMDAAYLELRADTEALATDPEVVAVDSGHDIPVERPDAVLDAIRWVYERLAG